MSRKGGVGKSSVTANLATAVAARGLRVGVLDADIGSPLGEVAGLDILEAGCGVAYFSAWLARRGARPVGLDPTPAQLATARRLQDETGIEFPLVEGVGEALPFPDGSFDLVLSEYGASLWADPFLWVPEAARVLRPGGRLVLVDFAQHEEESLREEHAHRWLGFRDADVEAIDNQIKRLQALGPDPAFISVHSFTPVLNGIARGTVRSSHLLHPSLQFVEISQMMFRKVSFDSPGADVRFEGRVVERQLWFA